MTAHDLLRKLRPRKIHKLSIQLNVDEKRAFGYCPISKRATEFPVNKVLLEAIKSNEKLSISTNCYCGKVVKYTIINNTDFILPILLECEPI